MKNVVPALFCLFLSVAVGKQVDNGCTSLTLTSKADVVATCDVVNVQYFVTYNLSDVTNAEDAVSRAVDLAESMKTAAEKLVNKELSVVFTSVVIPDNGTQADGDYETLGDDDYDMSFPEPWSLREDLQILRTKVDLLTTNATAAIPKKAPTLKVRFELQFREVPVSSADDARQLLSAFTRLQENGWKRHSKCALSEAAKQKSYDEAIEQALSTSQKKAQKTASLMGQTVGKLLHADVSYYGSPIIRNLPPDNLSPPDLDSDLVTVDVPFVLPTYTVEAFVTLEFCMTQEMGAQA